MSFCVIMSTASGMDEAKKLARLLLESRAAACVTAIPALSIYRWKGKILEEEEVLTIAKTTEEKASLAEEVIIRNHSYEVPEILVLSVASGSQSYLEWVRAEVSGDVAE